ncbi:hypothetical protein TIFTF001_032532 [Ficus carica]|uniref:Uncharacterized protein n=1 Tax=Ficus carica TaxID=3494 RepID=A0AA88J817_FICCA|nr:hypothetical protein TIFTF001_032532 [Ficus carica]
MAEIVVGPVIDKLIDLLIEEGKLFKGVHKEVKSLTDELESIKCFLKDAESRSGKGDVKDGVKIWVKQVRDEANHIEDVIDEYLRHVAPRRHESGFVGFLQKIHGSVKQIKARHHIASEVRDIKTSLREIKERSERYDFRLSSEEGPSGKCTTAAEQYDPRLDSIFIEEDDVVGIDSTRDDLISMLVDGASMRTVISLVGTGGVGKTTLASRVYDNEVVKKHFNCRRWITVSQSYDLKKLLKSMAEQLLINEEGPGDKTDEIEGLIKSLREHLNTQRYMVVFDDVWDIEFWEVIKHAFPKNDNGSRVIITSRNDFISASACQETSGGIVHKLQPLSEEMAWELFCKKAFQSKKSVSSSCPVELEELSRKIVGKCQGLPLVITAMARLLSTKEKIVSEWQIVLENMSTEFESKRQLTSTLKILSLSYDDLPHHLKSCFLYFGIFPEDYSISDARLYRLWIAEGFVKLKDKRPEDIAKEYLEELIHRNLVQVSYLECQAYDRMLKVHDMLREIILLKMDELGFCQILNAKNSRFQRRYRRLSIHGGVKNVQEIVEDSGVRSVFIFNVDELMQSFVVTLVKKFKLLRLLEFRDVPLDSLPKEVGDLFHLKYLGLRNTKVKMLPKSIGKLEKLQTLDLANTLVRELPFEINNLQSLRHFALWHYPKGLSNNFNSDCGVKIPQGIGCLEDLQSLWKVEAHHEGHGTINELGKLRQLRALSIAKLTTETGKALCGFIEKMTYLQRLQLSLIREDEILDLQSISSPPRLLRFLCLKGPLPHLPHWIASLQELWELSLTASKLHDEPLRLLHGLPNLQRLFLNGAYDGEELHFKEGGFQKLKVLSLKKLAELKVLKIDRGALPCLEKLEIGASQLKEVPSGIQHLHNLKTLRFHSMPKEFFHAMNPDGGQDYYKVMHVSSVTFWEEHGECFRVMKLRKSDSSDFCCAQHFRIL